MIKTANRARRRLPRPSRRQAGAALFMALVMMTVFLMFVAGMASLDDSSSRVQYSLQRREEMERAGVEALEAVVNSQDIFIEASKNTATVTNLAVNGYQVAVLPPKCAGTSALAYSVLSQVAAEETHWEVLAMVVDPRTNAKASVTQGIRMRMNLGSCPS